MASLAPHSGNLGTRLAAHLLRRLTFGFTRADVDAFAGMTANQAVEIPYGLVGRRMLSYDLGYPADGVFSP